MRVGVFYPTLNVYGGAEFVTMSIANTLAQNGYETCLFTNNKVNQKELEKFFGKKLHPDVKEIVRPTMISPRGLLDFYQTIFRSYIFKSKCDIWIDVYSCCIFPWSNITYIHFPFLNHYFYKSKFPYLKDRHLVPVGCLPYAFFEKNFRNDGGKLLLANSHYTAEEIRTFSGKKATVLYPPVPSIIYNDNPKKLNENQRKNLIVTISRFGPGKGLEKIPYIASLTQTNLQFAIIGRLHYKNTLLSLQKLTKKLGLTDRIKFFPDASRTEMKELLRSAKVYLHTMVGEHFGISIVEAMATGCIPIVHNSGGPKEYVPDDFRYKNVYDAAEKIEKAINEWSPSIAMKIIKIAEKFKEENFSNQFITLFKNYVESKQVCTHSHSDS